MQRHARGHSAYRVDDVYQPSVPLASVHPDLNPTIVLHRRRESLKAPARFGHVVENAERIGRVERFGHDRWKIDVALDDADCGKIPRVLESGLDGVAEVQSDECAHAIMR